MAKIQETVTVTIDETPYDVAALGDAAKQMIVLMDEWRQKEADLTSEILMTRAALRDIQNTLLATIKESVADEAPEVAA